MSKKTMKCMLYEGPQTVKFCEIAVPKPKRGNVLVQVKRCGICGTDLHIYKGEIKSFSQKGIVLGHEISGVVSQLGNEVEDFEIGTRVAIDPNLFCSKCEFCRTKKKHFCKNWNAIGVTLNGGFAEYVEVPSSACYVIPEGISFKKAALFEPLSCILHGISRASMEPCDTILVQGAGSIGLLFIQCLKKLGAYRIIVSDIDNNKLLLAKGYGADVLINVKEKDLNETVLQETNQLGVDLFIDAAGLLSTIPNSLKIVKCGGKVLIFGVPPENKTVEIEPYLIYRREIQIIGSFTNPNSNVTAMKFLEKIDHSKIISHVIDLNEIEEKGFKMMGKEGTFKIQVKISD
ncbi:l-threonine 3-dehydrogenase [Anaeramoeba flamelloides]|uniref:L-threonine 3-dehydrogenase n=1 Tax=Anaeramoeba flamelloides TaxID=1746091 RepID=A0AAV7ZKV6_9EUKA|nr:l-threonine 3-dehydrogenase [Anaeramoeba flamelloides]